MLSYHGGGQRMSIRLFLTAALFFAESCTENCETTSVEPVTQFQRASADSVEHGRRIANVLGCTGCHGADLTGEDWSGPEFGRLWTANLTRAVPRYNDQQLATVIRSGRRADRELWEMPSHLFTHLTPEDMSALITFLRTVPPSGAVHPEPVFEEGARKEIAAGTFKSSAKQVLEEGSLWPPDAGKAHALGRYIARATCAECHQMDLRGGKPNPEAKPRPDLRIVAAYEPDQFRRLLQMGLAAGDREVGLMSEVARGRYKHLTAGEIKALQLYLLRVTELDP